MTKPRYDKHSTEFGLWLREQDDVDSGLGYVATNIDYMWRNYKTGQWMLIEEKRYNSELRRWQKELFDLLNWCSKHHPRYRGFHVIQFEKTSPDDGKIFLDGNKITKAELIKFLQMD